MAPGPALPRTLAGVVEINGEVVVMGGCTIGNPCNAAGRTNRVEVYNPQAGTWRDGGILPVSSEGIAFDYNETPYFYAFEGGRVFRANTTNWSDLGPVAAGAQCLVVNGNSLLVLSTGAGGVDITQYGFPNLDYVGITPLQFDYPGSSGPDRFSCAVAGNKLFVIGGQWGGPNQYNLVSSLDLGDSTVKPWPAIPGGYSNGSTVTCGSNLIYTGGFEFDGGSLIPQPETWFISAVDAGVGWAPLPSLNHARTMAGAVKLDGGVMVVGGTTFLNVVAPSEMGLADLCP